MTLRRGVSRDLGESSCDPQVQLVQQRRRLLDSVARAVHNESRVCVDRDHRVGLADIEEVDLRRHVRRGRHRAGAPSGCGSNLVPPRLRNVASADNPD